MARDTSLSRRSALRVGLAASAAGVLATGFLATGSASASGHRRPAVHDELRELERQHGARLGVHATNTRTGATVAYRAGERFPMCSTFKTLAAAAILRDLDRDGEFLDRLIRYTEADIVENSVITAKRVATGMRIRELCWAAICHSDNTAGNLLLRQIGGPAGVTRFCRSLGDPHTRLDRYEAELNTAIPGDPRDTTTPAAIGRDYRHLVLGDALNCQDREQLTAWLKANTTSSKRFRAALPPSWELGDKTGSGRYGTVNDVGVTWTPDGTPIVLAVLTTKHEENATPDNELIVDTARLLARTLAPGQ
ncbi:class A beta-lactamase [Streptoalloteichus hindustanus]|uniref:Beta-lactamase n=1 Tax=Streptoalloteichus hindustanus TaxID=2017 RepID=A0A1M5CIF5_STRHI|nr:class A beta-lactamase [Streptoalloteichus hindustanus]SHF54555.1 beta-lactamase class A [Streptoalloteichus hindustanus]